MPVRHDTVRVCTRPLVGAHGVSQLLGAGPVAGGLGHLRCVGASGRAVRWAVLLCPQSAAAASAGGQPTHAPKRRPSSSCRVPLCAPVLPLCCPCAAPRRFPRFPRILAWMLPTLQVCRTCGLGAVAGRHWRACGQPAVGVRTWADGRPAFVLRADGGFLEASGHAVRRPTSSLLVVPLIPPPTAHSQLFTSSLAGGMPHVRRRWSRCGRLSRCREANDLACLDIDVQVSALLEPPLDCARERRRRLWNRRMETWRIGHVTVYVGQARNRLTASVSKYMCMYVRSMLNSAT
jgi:hypothetical protein